MISAADVFRGRKFPGGAPREEPSFHILVRDVVPGVYLPTGLAHFLCLSVLH